MDRHWTSTSAEDGREADVAETAMRRGRAAATVKSADPAVSQTPGRGTSFGLVGSASARIGIGVGIGIRLAL
ncbi:hypothetical protein MLD38_024651 [Melastoma candidum]|uniref:Uncharacterized protein n=1 Tax=Melastoma candidum TaxID=119954 RepID=A0ACB9NTW8_9MYRT|nr:hypothetical protein MLD38_024651 [Melastoma candidum]